MWFRKLENSTESYFDEMLGDQNLNWKNQVKNIIFIKLYRYIGVLKKRYFSLNLKILWVYVRMLITFIPL